MQNSSKWVTGALAIAALAACNNNPGAGIVLEEDQWELVVFVVNTNGANGKVTVDPTNAYALMGECTSECAYAVTEGVQPLELVADGENFTRWTGDCDTTTPSTSVVATRGAHRECTATFDAGGGGGEICDNKTDDDADGDLDCSDSDCSADPLCAAANFGDFADDDDGAFVFNHVGTTTCGLPEVMDAFSLTPGGLIFPTWGANTNTFFGLVPATTNQAKATGQIILGAPDHTCTLFESEFGNPLQLVFSFNCTNPGGGTCSQGYNAVRQ